jgi:hypothetical protein
MMINLTPYAVYSENDFVDQLISRHFDPAEAIRACGEGMYIEAADEHAQKRLDAEYARQRELPVDVAEETQPVASFRLELARVDTDDVVPPLVADSAPVDTDNVVPLPVAEPTSVNTDDPIALLEMFNSVGTSLYRYLVTQNIRVGQPTSVMAWGDEEKILHFGRQGGLNYGRVTVKRSNGLPQPVSSPAAALFQHFVKIQYRDVRSIVIQQVLEDYVKGGGVPITTSGPAATNDAELAFWLHCKEARKACIRLEDTNGGRSITAYCPQGTCFHPDAAAYIGEILCLHANPSSTTFSGISISAWCDDEGGEKAAQAIVKLFAEAPGLLVRDWPLPL